MAFYAQHGYGKSDKIPEALRDESIGGVVFSARDERPASLAACIAAVRRDYPTARLMVDPQFQMSVYRPAKDRYLSEYPYYIPGRGMTDFVGSKVRGYVQSTLDSQRDLQVDVLVAPTIHVEGFEEREHQVALNLASEAMDYHAGIAGEARPLFISFLIGEHAFAALRGVDEFLNQVTAWDVQGMYLTVARAEPGYSHNFEATRLSHIMYTAYILGALNEIELVSGYSDIHGALLRAAGASAFAAGWSQSCRRYHRSSFLDRRGGGRRPRLRYCSIPLLSSIYLGELEQIHDVGALDRVLSGTDLDSVITDSPSPESSRWDQRTAGLQHWQALSALDGATTGDVAEDMTRLQRAILSAQAIYAELQIAGVAFDRGSRGDHLAEWADAIVRFRSLAEL